MAETADDNKLKEKLSATPPLPQPKTEETNSVAAEEERGEQEEAEKAGPVKSKHEDIKIPEDDKIDKLDELSSLEQEIAKMHNLQHDDDTETETDQLAKELAEQAKDAGDSAATENGNASNEALLTDELVSRRRTPVNHNKDETASAATLKDVDLIALLKGTDQEQEQPTATAAAAADQKSIELALAELDNLGVTIEGEGQYEIMEIDDGDNGSAASPVVLPAAVAAAAPKSTAKGKAKLSPEQARAVALEQMADLKAQTARRKEAAAKQQQQQQQQQQPQQQPMDIVSSLNDDWNEYDSGSDNNSNSHSNANSNLTAASKRPIAKKASKASSESVGNAKALTKSPTQSALDKLKAATTVEPANNNNSPEATGYKRTRVIKRKIIWDPDMPEAQRSLAQYATTKAGGSNRASPTATATVTSERPTTPRASGQESMKRSRPMTPKDVHKVAAKRVATPAKLNESNVASTTTANRRAQTPNGAASGSVVQVKKKKVSEIDRLMGDEGAANMMQAVEREQRELSGGESPNKPLMRKRSLTITGRQQQQQQPQKANASELMSPTTPKKESPPKAYKRASTPAAAIDAVFKNNKAATPKPQPSDSWDYVYKQRASEESMIMRRRSNSSYSSNASASRLSLDNRPAAVANLSDDASDAPANDPAFKFLKPETKTNQRNDGSPPQTLANDLKQQQLPKESKASAKTELITLHKLEKVSQLIVNMQPSKTGYTYKLQLLQKLTEMLNKLAKSNDCNIVLLSVGQGQTFCQGIDCQELIASALDKRKSGANQLGLVLKTYLRTLLTFPKPLVAGVVGNLKNLGVMQLPLFDYVVSADDCSLETSYAKLGQLPEGYALWHNHPKVSSQVHNRLFLLGEQLQALELVTTVGGNSFIDKCCKARSVNDEALEVAKLISNSTAEHYRGLKKLNQTANAALLPSLDAEFKILTEQWASAQFQANCKRYVSDLNI